jgi:hypothetical protein
MSIVFEDFRARVANANTTSRWKAATTFLANHGMNLLRLGATIAAALA